MADEFQIAVAGAGLMGQRHASVIETADGIELIALVDPSEAGRVVASKAGIDHYESLASLFEEKKPDGIILATPNHLHVDQGLECIEAGVPLLVEKPIGTDVAVAVTLVRAAEASSIPLLVGHHRRHNPLIKAAKQAIEQGAIGRITAVQGTCWLYKPDDYFNVAWRKEPGAGPVFINLIHDLDLLRMLCGEIVSVTAYEANAIRSHSVEDTAAIILRFENGALGTINVSDCIVGPWSWEMTAQENPAYPSTDQACYLIGGTHGSLEIPTMRLWQQPKKRGWWEEITSKNISSEMCDPLVEQLEHFRDVALGRCDPLVSGREALQTLAVVEALKKSSASTNAIAVAPPDVRLA